MKVYSLGRFFLSVQSTSLNNQGREGRTQMVLITELLGFYEETRRSSHRVPASARVYMGRATQEFR